jgi:hypothetical protein
MPNRKRDSKGRFKDAAFFDSIRDRPGASAAVIAGAAGVAAAGAFLWTRREQVREALNSGIDRLSELKAERMGASDEAAQEDFSEEALTLKETGKKSRGPRGPIAQQDIKAGMASAE